MGTCFHERKERGKQKKNGGKMDTYNEGMNDWWEGGREEVRKERRKKGWVHAFMKGRKEGNKKRMAERWMDRCTGGRNEGRVQAIETCEFGKNYEFSINLSRFHILLTTLLSPRIGRD